MNPVTVALRHFQLLWKVCTRVVANVLDYVIFVAFQNNCKCLNSFWMHVVALCRYNVTRIEGTELPFSHMHNCTCITD